MRAFCLLFLLACLMQDADRKAVCTCHGRAAAGRRESRRRSPRANSASAKPKHWRRTSHGAGGPEQNAPPPTEPAISRQAHRSKCHDPPHSPFIGYRAGTLYVEDVPLAQIAARLGTPCFVYSRAALTHAFEAFSQPFGSRAHAACYAAKANSNLAVLDLFARLGSASTSSRAVNWSACSPPEATRARWCSQAWASAPMRSSWRSTRASCASTSNQPANSSASRRSPRAGASPRASACG